MRNLSKIASLNDLKRVLGTDTDKTVFRKLKKISYRSSYSHRGKYYTADGIADFDKSGLWSHNDIYFSVYGTLSDTVGHFVENSEAGHSVRELDDILHVSTKKSLLNIHRKQIICRKKIAGIFYYFSANSVTHGRQRQLRESRQEELASVTVKTHDLPSEKKAAILLFFGTLNEKERRFYAGLEASKLGHGGDKKISELPGPDVHTVAKGRKELLSGGIDTDRVRKAGGGRKKMKKKFRQ